MLHTTLESTHRGHTHHTHLPRSTSSSPFQSDSWVSPALGFQVRRLPTLPARQTQQVVTGNGQRRLDNSAELLSHCLSRSRFSSSTPGISLGSRHSPPSSDLPSAYHFNPVQNDHWTWSHRRYTVPRCASEGGNSHTRLQKTLWHASLWGAAPNSRTRPPRMPTL